MWVEVLALMGLYADYQMFLCAQGGLLTSGRASGEEALDLERSESPFLE